MDLENSLSDNEFIPFLHNLGVETFNKSFEWTLNDPEFSGVMRWLYNNLDHNNALTAREEYRYKELQKCDQLIPPDELESTITHIQDQYPGICLPGDKKRIEDVKLDISMQKERLQMSERNEKVMKDLVEKNEAIKQQLSVSLTQLNSAYQQCKEDTETASTQCVTLANDVEKMSDNVVSVVGETLEMYANCQVNKEIAKKFLTFSPLETYRQSQALFKSHFDLYTTKKFGRKENVYSDDDLRNTLVEARNLEERLSEAAYIYIDTRAELAGEQAKLNLVVNYTAVHPSQITPLAMEAKASVELMSQEESIIEQQIQAAIKDLVTQRTRLAVDTTTRCALDIRERIHTSLCHLSCSLQQALSLDRLLYCAVRHELTSIQQLAIFAAQLKQHVLMESDAVVIRIESMNEIISDQESSERNLQSYDKLTSAIQKLLSIQITENDPSLYVKVYGELQYKMKELFDDVLNNFEKKQLKINDFKTSLHPLHNYLFCGNTRQPSRSDPISSSLSHTLKQNMAALDDRIVKVAKMFSGVKSEDKHNLRKLWQWYLTDETKLLAATKGIAHPSV